MLYQVSSFCYTYLFIGSACLKCSNSVSEVLYPVFDALSVACSSFVAVCVCERERAAMKGFRADIWSDCMEDKFGRGETGSGKLEIE